ncbi:MAG: prepilin-type N-terminal cleavage/methylation domain-containing protein [Planctomycetia bacterium]|nr:prepilin-type N-terminal cleavage/methylation domain-containing protein [Planctomycetia bacterium]
MSNQARRCEGFSLLEVIIATAILATSTVLLLGLFSTGERHAKKAETRVLAQMLCQSKLDELLADASLLAIVDDEPLAGYDDWMYSVDWTPTEIDGLVRLRVSVREVETLDQLERTAAAPGRNAFELVRWMRFEPRNDRFSDRDSDSIVPPSQP